MAHQDDSYEILEPTLGHALSVWWLFAWRSLAGSLVLGVLFGLLVAVTLYLFAGGSTTASLFTAVGGGAIGIVWGIYVIRMALRKNYRGFRILVVREDPI